MEVAKYLVQGVDVWLNNPDRGMEASGTSGMKASLNGVLNLSVLDGWWAEGYLPGAGWALPEENTFDRKDFQDELDSEMIYHLLEKEVIPLYYERNKDGVPSQWVDMIRHSFAEIVPRFTTHRMIDEYINKYYVPLFERSKKSHVRTSKSGTFRMETTCDRELGLVKIIDTIIHDSAQKPLPLGRRIHAEIVLSLGYLKPEDIGVEVLFIQKSGKR